jgi:DNA polymerase (family X)
MSTNSDAAELFLGIADLLDVLGEKFKPEAYRRAARSIESLTEDLRAVEARGELRSIPGVGEAIEEKLREFLSSGKVEYYERLRKEVPAGVLELMRLPGLGPKTARRFWVELAIDGPDGLRSAIEAGRLDGVRGFGEKKIAQLRAMLGEAKRPGEGTRLPIELAYPLARHLVQVLAEEAGAREVALAGSFRRGRETVGDLDILVTSETPETVFDAFSKLPEVRTVRMRGGTKETVVLTNGLQADLRVVEPAAFGAALQYFTGSKDHNVRLRSLARDLGLKVNEYGVFRGEERVASRTEEEVYRALGLSWIPPELREDRGEIELAARGPYPKIVEAGDLLGDLHVHLDAGASAGTVDGLLRAAGARHLQYVGVVVAAVTTAEGPYTAAPEVIEAVRRSGHSTPRAYLVAEVGPGAVPSTVAELAPEYLIVRPDPAAGAAAPNRSRGPPVALIAHEGGGSARIDMDLRLAAALGAAVEVGPGPERLDSTAARSARERGVALAVPTGVGEPAGSATAEVALAFARRAGARAQDVANSRRPATVGKSVPVR